MSINYNVLLLMLFFPLLANGMEATKLEQLPENTEENYEGLSLSYRKLTELEKDQLIHVYEMFTGVLSKDSSDNKLLILPNLHPCLAVVIKNKNRDIVVTYHDYFDSEISFSISNYVENLLKVLQCAKGDKIGVSIYANLSLQDGGPSALQQKISIEEWFKYLKRFFSEEHIEPINESQPMLIVHNLDKQSPETKEKFLESSYPLAEFNVLVDKHGKLYNTCPMREDLYKSIKAWDKKSKHYKLKYEFFRSRFSESFAYQQLGAIARDIYLEPFGEYEWTDMVNEESGKLGFYQSGFLY